MKMNNQTISVAYFDIAEMTIKAFKGDKEALHLIEQRKQVRHLANKRLVEEEFPHIDLPI